MITLELDEIMAELILSEMYDHIIFCNKGMKKWNKRQPLMFEAFEKSKLDAQKLRDEILKKLGRK